MSYHCNMFKRFMNRKCVTLFEDSHGCFWLHNVRVAESETFSCYAQLLFSRVTLIGNFHQSEAGEQTMQHSHISSVKASFWSDYWTMSTTKQYSVVLLMMHRTSLYYFHTILPFNISIISTTKYFPICLC